jgi:hypothetical protein
MKPTKTEDHYIQQHELQRRLHKLGAEQQATAVAEKSLLREVALAALPEMRPGIVHPAIRPGGN